MRQGVLIVILLIGWSSLEVMASENAPPSTVEVDLKQGTIKTSKVDLEDGKYYYAFRNIPFAAPPVGPLRFKNPKPAGPWSGTRDGTVTPKPCPQFSLEAFFTGEVAIDGDEDCLYLDVYTPSPELSDLPVMVWIHGGAFVLGSIAQYSPEPLMTGDVVIVSIQYRLNTLGFLSTEDSAIPGNLGMKDQVMALRWVKENIQSLGGDPERVTIFGESAGGISVHLHMLSPMSEGLFHRAIAQSGTALLPGYVRSKGKARKTAVALGQMLKCQGVDPDDFNSQALYDCLQEVPATKLVELANAFGEFFMMPIVMVPNVDGEFLPDHHMKLMKEGRYNKVNFMTGVNRDEGAFSVLPMLQNRAMIESLVENFTTNGPIVFNLDGDAKLYTAKRIFFYYLNEMNITEENEKQAVQMFGHLNFNIPLDITAKIHARDAAYGKKIFFYEFHHVGEVSFIQAMNLTTKSKNEWVTHGDDLMYFFKIPGFSTEITTPKDKFMQELLIKLWTNFARTGNPTPDLSLGFKWTPASNPQEIPYLILDTSPSMEKNLRQEEYELWTNLPTEQNIMLDPEKFKPE